MGVKAEYTPEQMLPLQQLDPVFLQGTTSANDTYAYFSGKCSHFYVPRQDWNQQLTGWQSLIPPVIIHLTL
jgi:hypothetical protein